MEPNAFLELLPQPRPDPGGGAAAAFVGHLAVGLALKVARIELGRGKNTSFWAEEERIVAALREDFCLHQDADIAAYADFVQARVQVKAEDVKRASVEIFEVPMLMIRSSGEALAELLKIAAACAPHLRSDVLAAAELLGGVILAAAAIGEANLQWLESGLREDKHRQLRDAVSEAFAALHALRQQK